MIFTSVENVTKFNFLFYWISCFYWSEYNWSNVLLIYQGFTAQLKVFYKGFTRLQLSWKIPLQDTKSFGWDPLQPRLHGLTSVMSCWWFQARVKREDLDAWGRWSSTVRYGWFLEQTLSAPQRWEHCQWLFTQMTVVSPPPASRSRFVQLVFGNTQCGISLP